MAYLYRRNRPHIFGTDEYILVNPSCGSTRNKTPSLSSFALASNSMIARFSWSGWYPTCEIPITGFRRQSGLLFGVILHFTAASVKSSGTVDLAINQPFCAVFRPSSNWILPSPTCSMVKKRSASSGAMVSFEPVASGNGSKPPLGLGFIGPFACLGNTPEVFPR